MTIRFIHLGVQLFAWRLEVIDPDFIGLDAVNLDISDIGGVKHRLDLWGRAATEISGATCTCGAAGWLAGSCASGGAR